MFKKYRHLLFLFFCIILIFSVNTKVYAAETITEERPAETTAAEETTSEEGTAEESAETIPDEEPEAVGDETLVETTSAEEPTVDETTVTEATAEDDNEEAIPTEETETEAVAEEALVTEGLPEEPDVETATEAKPEERLIEENPDQIEEACPKVGLRGGSRPPGWSQDEYGNWYYYNADGTPYNGWLLYDGHWYYISNGIMCTGPTWIEDASGGGYYWRLNDLGRLEEKAGWVDSGHGNWIYFASTGKGYDGWLSYNGYWYYIERGVPSRGRIKIYDDNTGQYDYWHFDYNGRLITDAAWYQDDEGRWFYRFGGKDHVGWLRLSNKWYFIDSYRGMYSDKESVGWILYNFGADGALIVDQKGWVKIGDDWYYLNQDGTYHEGWLSYNGHWYYTRDGRMRTGLTTINGYYWRLNGAGQLEAKAGWVEEYGSWYYFDSNGKGYNGWLPYNGKWYYIDKGYMCSGPSIDQDGYHWRLKDSGELEAKAGWVIESGIYWYYFDHNGKGYDGWLRYNNQWYYLWKGYMLSGPSQDQDGYFWRLKDSGELEERGGWCWLNNEENPNWLYFSSNGKGYDGWLKYNNQWYYFDKGYMLKDGFKNAGGKLCEFNEEGVWIRNLKGWVKKYGYYYYANQDSTIPAGWLKYNNKWYYIHEDGQMAFYPTEIDGKRYLFETSGALASGWFKYEHHAGGYSLHYANSNGTAYQGWLQQGSKWYYIDNGAVQEHACRIDGKAHKFDRYGVWISEQ